MTASCLFCRIIAGTLPATRLGESESALAIADIAPQAPVHVVVMPKLHVTSVETIPEGHVVAQLVDLARAVAREVGCAETGYRLVINTGSDGGQTVPHLHLHLLAGRALRWPPG